MMSNGYGGYAEFTNGIDGTYIDENGKMYVEESLLWDAFGDAVDPPVEINVARDTAVLASVITFSIKAPSIAKGTSKFAKTYIVPIVMGIGGKSYNNLNSGVNFAEKALQHMEEPGRFVPVSTLIEAIKYGTPSPDPQGTNAVMYTIEMARNGKVYELEVLYDEVTNTIWHFMYH